MKKIIIISLVLATSSIAQEKILSLEDCLQKGLKNSEEIKIAKSKVIGSEERITEIRAQMLPKLSFGASYSNLNVIEPKELKIIPGRPITIKNPFYSYGLNLRLQTPIFTGFRLTSLKSTAELNAQAIKSELQSTINQKAFGIHSTYWNLYKAKNSTELIQQYLLSLQKKLKDTEQFLENGLVTKNDVLKLKVEVSNAELKLIDAKNRQEVARALLNKTIGLPLNHQTEIEADVTIDTVRGYSYDELIYSALNNRTEMKSIEYRIEAGEKNISAANSGWWPHLYAVGSFHYHNLHAETFSVSKEPLKLWFVGLSLSWDLWDWGYTSAKSSQATQEVLQIREKMGLLKKQIEIEVYKNYLSLISEKQKINISNLAVESADENYRITEDKYSNQISTSTDLINAQTDLMNAKTQLANSIADYNLAIVRLEMSSGREIY
jgi:outer membrane protein TolC